ncbi:MAG: hypothetical protein RLO52_19855 [Sandaracinaceae bacterium]
MTTERMYSATCMALCAFAASCSLPSASLLEDEDASERRLSRMNIVVVDSSGARSQVSVDQVGGYIETHCKAMLDAEISPPPASNPCDSPPPDGCGRAVCLSQLELCRALTFREIAQAEAQVTLVNSSRDAAYALPSQDAESRVASEQAAQVAAARAVFWAGDGLLSSCGEGVDPVDSPFGPPLAKLSNPNDLLASTLAEALHVGELAAEAGAQGALGVADRDRTGISDLGRAARLSWFDDNLSRLVAAQSHAGGVVYGAVAAPTWTFVAGDYEDDPSLPYRTASSGATTLEAEGIGAQPPCRNNCEVALGALRRSGVPLTDIMNPTVDLDDLASTAVTRTEARRGIELFAGTDASSFADGLGVSTTALRRAREWMRHEAIIFARPTGILTGDLPAPPMADGTPQTVSGYDSTTMTPPRPPPPMHYITGARAATLWHESQTFSGPDSPTLPILRPERAYLFGYVNAVAAEAMSREDNHLSPTGDPEEAGAVRRTLATIATMARARKAVDAEVCVDGSNLRVRLFGTDLAPTMDGQEYLLLTGLDQLRCAVDGSLGGQACTVSGQAPLVGYQTVSGARTSRRRAVQWSTPLPVGTSPATLYVVRTRGGFQGPGAYEAIAGIPATGLAGNAGKCTTVPYDYLSVAAAGHDLEIAEDAAPGHACSGLPDRLPLEDEIIDDGDLYEDSWQHHLRVAASTAAHADDLGQRLITSGLQMDEQAQLAVDELQTLCGVHVNLDGLIGADGSLQDLIHPTGCNEPLADFTCADGYECMGTQCVAQDLLGAPGTSQREALEECLGVGDAGAIVEAVALGRDTLCAWRPVNEPHRLCAYSQEPCPRIKQAGTECQPPADWDAMLHGAVEVVQITNAQLAGMGEPTDIGEVLGIVGSVAPGGSPPPGATVPPVQSIESMCDAVNAARTSGRNHEEGSAYWDRLRGENEHSHFWNFANIQYWAGRIGWTGEPGDFSYFTLDGSRLRNSNGTILGGTGTLSGGPETTTWPCGGAYAPSETEGLTDIRANCDDPTNGPLYRARLNWRMARAATTLASLAAVGMDNIRYPTFYDAWDRGNMAEIRGTTDAGDYRRAPYLPVDGQTSGDVWGPIGLAEGTVLWHAPNGFRVESREGACPGWPVLCANTTMPLSFLNFGTKFNGDDYVRAEYIGSTLWQGLGSMPVDTSAGGSYGFFDLIPVGVRTEGRPRSLFWNALSRRSDSWDTVYVVHGREYDQARFREMSQVFSPPVWEAVGDSRSHLNLLAPFSVDHGSQEAEAGYGPYVTRRDLLDALELVCTVASFQPPPPGTSTDLGAEDQLPVVDSVDDIASVRRYAERLAIGFDALARAQIVQDVPSEVVDAVRIDDVGDATSDRSRDPDVPTGEYGRQMVSIRQQLRTMGTAPSDIAGALRQLSAELDIMRRNQQIFEREVQVHFLRFTVGILQDTYKCMQTNTGAQVTTGVGVVLCGILGAIRVLEGIITTLQVENLTADQLNRFEQFKLAVTGVFDVIESRRIDFLNAVDGLRSSLSTLSESRAQAQSQLARVVFASSDAGGRHYQTNTVMRRAYDINLQRYRSAHRAAVRSAAIARMSVEQRFGVDLDTETCAQLVDPPHTWASDVCNATGVNYGAIRDASVEIDEDSVRQMFIGDYVRRLEQYVESHRFDFPYSSGEDTMVMSMRDDVVRARGVCVDRSVNLVGVANDLTARQLPGEGTEGASRAAWDVRDCATAIAEDCVSVTRGRGPRWAVTGSTETAPVVGRIESQPPRGHTVTFAPRSAEPYVGDYQNGASLSQEVYLAPGTYRLSWYQKASGGYVPTVDLRVDAASPSSTTVHDVTPRPLSDGWTRHMRFVTVTSAQADAPMLVGVFSAIVPSNELHSIDVAGIQLEDATYLDIDTASPGVADHPALFEATLAPGLARFEDCEIGTPREFQGGWTRGCVQLCSGGFSERCREGEEPAEMCYREVVFSLDEGQLLGRGSQFGGGFAFGNYNYRTGDIAVNVVGTGTRRCGDSESCYSTASVPFSLIHMPPGDVAGSPGAYSVRTHDGSLHPVRLFEGRVESGRALAAERYLTNPLSSSDRGLLADYMRREFRGRPMTGTYRLMLWETGALAFENVEDVQVLWNYRYFTRTGEPYVCE